MSRFGVVVGICTERGADQLKAINSVANYSEPSTQLIAVFNGVEPFSISPRYEVVHLPTLVGLPQGVWRVGYDLACARGWDWLGTFHDDFYLLSQGWEQWLREANRTHKIGMASFAAYSRIEAVSHNDAEYSYSTGNVELVHPGFLAVVIDGCGGVFNMSLFSSRGGLTPNTAPCGHAETESALWTLSQGWACGRIPLPSDHHPDGTTNTRDFVNVGADGASDAIAAHLDVLPARVLDSDRISLAGKVVDVRRRAISVLRPVGGEEEIQAVAEVIRSGWWGRGPKVAEFESKFSKMVGAKHALAITSNTHGLDLVLKAKGIKGADVISPTISFMSTGVVPLWNDCTSTLCDVDAQTLCIDPKDVQAQLKPNTKAIIAVNMAGVPADIFALRKFYDGLIIEDCAHSCYAPGAGKQGDVAVWSFQAVKTMPCGDGGMITTDDSEFYELLRAMVWVGIRESTFDRVNKGVVIGGRSTPGYAWDYEVDILGYKAYMIDLLAAICLVQMNRLPRHLEIRRAVQARYNAELPKEVARPVYSDTVQYYCARVPGEHRNALMAAMAACGIHTSVHFKPLHLHPILRQARSFPVADSVWPGLISLPCHPGLSDEDVDYVVQSVRDYFR